MSNTEIATASAVVNTPSESPFQDAIDNFDDAISEAENGADELRARVLDFVENALIDLEGSDTATLANVVRQLNGLHAQVDYVGDEIKRLIDLAVEYGDAAPDEDEAAVR